LKTGMLLIFGKQMSVLFGLKFLFFRGFRKISNIYKLIFVRFAFNLHNIFAAITSLQTFIYLECGLREFCTTLPFSE
jgi:hypothetical protein